MRPSALERHEAVGAELQEQDDEHEHERLADAGRVQYSVKRVDEAEGERRDHRAAELAEAADDHDEEGVDDVA